MNILLLFILFIIPSEQLSSDKPSFYSRFDDGNIEGTYKLCPFHCLIIEVKSNLTFNYKLVGDLYTGEFANGKLIPLGDGYFLANSNIQPYAPREFETNRESIIISIKDENDEPLGYSNIWINSIDSSFDTDSLGNLIIPHYELKTIQVNFMNSTIDYEISNSNADSIIINHLTGSEIILIQNERWLFKDDSLFLPGTVGIPRVSN